MGNNELYLNQKARNQRAKELRTRGHNVRKSSVRNQLLHPMYIEDYPRQLTSEERGFGNTLYKTYFKVLYEVSYE